MTNRYILGIETSCDDSAVALVNRAGQVAAAHTVGQTSIHTKFGGVFPEFASRAHVSAIIPTIARAFEQADISPEQIEAIAVTRGPGLIGPLLVGLNAAAALGVCWQKPVIGVNHLRGHLRSADLEEKRVTYPALILLVSGGHSLLAAMQSPADISVLGASRDDSLGEAYDKVARMLGLGFPGGPAIDRLAASGTESLQLPRPLIRQGTDFSFSGLKSAVARLLEAQPDLEPADVAASFVAAVLDILTDKVSTALLLQNFQSLIVVGGVSASRQIRTRMEEIAKDAKVNLCLPPLKWATDNGAMIALAGYDYLDRGILPPPAGESRLPVTVF